MAENLIKSRHRWTQVSSMTSLRCSGGLRGVGGVSGPGPGDTPFPFPPPDQPISWCITCMHTCSPLLLSRATNKPRAKLLLRLCLGSVIVGVSLYQMGNLFSGVFFFFNLVTVERVKNKPSPLTISTLGIKGKPENEEKFNCRCSSFAD